MLMTIDVFDRHQLTATMIQFFYVGGLLSLFLYNMVIFLTNRDRIYLFYCLFTVAVGCGMIAGNGYGRIFLWTDWPQFDRVAQSLFLALGSIFAVLFSMTFFELRKRTTLIDQFLKIIIAGYLAIAIVLLASVGVDLSVNWPHIFLFLLSSIGSLICLGVAIYLAFWRKLRQAPYFVFSWGFVCVGAITESLRAFGLMPSHWLTLHALQISAGLEALFFSFALADRLKTDRREQEIVQKALLQSKQETIQALNLSEDKLKKAVDIRTEELRAMLLHEQQVRDQYVRFGAMIAHDFRNPLNVIATQNSLIEIDPTHDPKKIAKRVGAIRNAVTHLSTLFEQWLQSDRINQAFAKITPIPTDATHLIQDVVNLSRVTHFDHRIMGTHTGSPLVICVDRSLMRIALLNVIDNACNCSPKKSTVCVGIELRDEWVGLYVKDESIDNALGRQTDIFQSDGQITSIDKSSGDGLGLSFVKRVIEMHKGRVEVTRHPNHGSTLTLWIKHFND